MINSSLKKQLGAALFIISIMLVVTSTLIIMFAANQGQMLQKITANQTRNNQAYLAAEAGMEFGINYFKINASTITASPSGGFIQPFSNSSTTNVTLANNSRYSIVFTNPIANNYDLIEITSTGTSEDGTATRVISQQIQLGSILSTIPTTPMITKGAMDLSGNAGITNTETDQTIDSASSVVFSGSARTYLSDGGGGTSGPDIIQDDTTLQNQSDNDLFATYLGTTPSAVKSQAEHYYSNTTNTNYSGTLNNMTGTTIWIDQLSGIASLASNVTIGSSANPVLIIVNGNFALSGNATIYGFIFIIGGSTLTNTTGNSDIYGGVISTGNFNMSGSTNITYNSSVLTNLQNQNSMKYYAKVPGSWKDF